VTPNAALAYQVLDHIDAHPEQWNQGIYIGEASCGSVGCFAGWTVLLSGAVPVYDEFSGGLTDVVMVDGEPRIVSSYAQELLGIDRYVDEDTEGERDLFDGSHSREDLGEMVVEIFGPRPDGGEPGPIKPPYGTAVPADWDRGGEGGSLAGEPS
jgi:hypothetical protein